MPTFFENYSLHIEYDFGLEVYFNYDKLKTALQARFMIYKKTSNIPSFNIICYIK